MGKRKKYFLKSLIMKEKNKEKNMNTNFTKKQIKDNLSKVNSYITLSQKGLNLIIKVVTTFINSLWYILQRLFLLTFIIVLFIWFAWWSSQTPSLYRDWTTTESILSEISFNDNIIDVKNVRNFNHISKTESIPWYYDEQYNLDEIESLYYIIEPFSEYDWPAHTMLSFGFVDWKYVTVSAELRKEKGEWFDPFLWLMNQFEIVYIVGDENDLIKLRANIRKDIVRLYPMNATKDQIQQLFSSVLHRADKLSKEPEFYNTFWNTCTTSILKHVNTLRDNKISSFDMRILLPSNSDKIAFDLWLIDTKLDLLEARSYYEINILSELFWNDKNYSEKIRVQKK